MALWKKVVFIVVLISFIGLSVFFTFWAIARDTYEFEEQTDIGGISGLNGWVFTGFSGSTATTTVNIDWVRDKNGNNPDMSEPVVAVDSFTIVSDEYVEYINIGKDVQYIDEQAFFYCKKLRAVTVDPDNPYFRSVDGVLYSSDMTELHLHPICAGGHTGDDGKEAYSDTFDIPEGVTRVCGYSFYKNTSLIHLTFPSTLKEIGDMAFFGCNGMWTVWLPDGLESVGNDAFSYCWSMSPLMYIPASVTHIGSNAFFSCSALKEFYMGAQSADGIELGETWLPKNIKKAIVKVAPKPEWGKTREEALAEKARVDGEKTTAESE